MVYYRNISYSIFAKLIQDIRFWIVVLLGFLNLIVDIALGDHLFAPLFSFIYLLAIVVFMSMDVLKTKSRPLAMGAGTMFLIIVLWNTYANIFTEDRGVSVITLGEGNTIYRHTMRRTIHLQIFLFNFEALVTLVKDRGMEKIVFLKAPVYRKTGTSSKVFEENSFVRQRTDELQNQNSTLMTQSMV